MVSVRCRTGYAGIHRGKKPADAGFSEDQQLASDRLYAELRLQYSDMAVLIAAIKTDVDKLASRTGSRVGGDSSPVSVINTGSRTISSSAGFYNEIERQIKERLRRLSSIDGFEDIDLDPKNVNVSELERRVREYIESQSV